MENTESRIIESRRALVNAFERNKDIGFILAELEPYRGSKKEIRKQAESLMKICLVDMGYIPLYLQYIFRRVLLEFRCGDFSKLYYSMKYDNGVLVDLWDARSDSFQAALINKTKANIMRGVNSTLAAKGLQGVTIAALGTKFAETAFSEIINIKLMLESAAASFGVGASSLYTVVSAGGVFALTGALSFSCAVTSDIKYALAAFIEILEYIDPPDMVKELRLDIFLDLLREELTNRSVFDKDYLNYLLSEFQCYGDFVEFGKKVKPPDYQSSVPFCMLMLQDFGLGDVSDYVLGLIAEFCEMKDVNFESAVRKFDRLNKNEKGHAVNSQRILAERKRNKRTVIEVDPYV